jgi:hypothetical protein
MTNYIITQNWSGVRVSRSFTSELEANIEFNWLTSHRPVWCKASLRRVER